MLVMNTFNQCSNKWPKYYSEQIIRTFTLFDSTYRLQTNGQQLAERGPIAVQDCPKCSTAIYTGHKGT